MKVVIKEPLEAPRRADIENTLTALQETVGGNIEHIGFAFPDMPEGIGILVDEEGKFRNKLPNFFLPGDIVAGTAVFVGESGEEFTDLTEEQLSLIEAAFSEADPDAI